MRALPSITVTAIILALFGCRCPVGQGTITTTTTTTEAHGAQWARTISSGSVAAGFYGLAADSAGNTYAVGLIDSGTYNFGGKSTPVTAPTGGSNAVIVRYDSNGVAQWAVSAQTASGDSKFTGVAIDGAGNLYAVGYITGTGTYNFGGSQGTVTGPSTSVNTVVVKYSAAGAAQWAQTVASGANGSQFYAVAVDNTSGSVYAAGDLSGTGTYSWGTSSSITGADNGGNTVIVKYNTSGSAQWAKTVTVGGSNTFDSHFRGVATDSAANAYAVGYLSGGTDSYSFGGSSTPVNVPSGGGGTIIVKYSAAGVAQWAQSVSSAASSSSNFVGVAVDSSGNAVAAGQIVGTYAYNFGGNSTTLNGISNSTGYNPIIVKYNSSGIAQWSATVTAGSVGSAYSAVALDPAGNAYATGEILGNATYNFGGNSSPVAGSNSDVSDANEGNIVLVKYNSSGIAQKAQSLSSGPSISLFNAVAADSSGNAYAAGEFGAGTYNFGGISSALMANNSISNPLIVKYALP